MGVFIVICAMIFLLVWYMVSREFYAVAEAKGFPEKKYLWITFFLGVAGALLIVALPDRGIKENDSDKTNDTMNNNVSEAKKTSKLVSLITDATLYTQTEVENIKEPDLDNSSNIEKLEYYKKLFDSGKISEEEFVEMRKMLIGN